jgi:hypothetical protein
MHESNGLCHIWKSPEVSNQKLTDRPGVEYFSDAASITSDSIDRLHQVSERRKWFDNLVMELLCNIVQKHYAAPESSSASLSGRAVPCLKKYLIEFCSMKSAISQSM